MGQVGGVQRVTSRRADTPEEQQQQQESSARRKQEKQTTKTSAAMEKSVSRFLSLHISFSIFALIW